MASATVLWRLFRKGDPGKGAGDPKKGSPLQGGEGEGSPLRQTPQHARAVILPGGPPHTLAFFVNDAMDRAENYDTMELALFRADDVKRSLVEEGWQEEE